MSEEKASLPLRVAHIITRMDSGGSATNTLVSVDRLRDCGFQTTLIYGKTDENEKFRQILKDRRIDFQYVPQLVREISPFHDTAVLFKLVHILRKGMYDLVHTHSSKAGILGRLAARILGIPCIHTPHGHVFYGYFNAAKTGLYIAIEKIAARTCARIVSLTDKETTEYLARGIGKPEQYVTIHSGVPLTRFMNIDKCRGTSFRSNRDIPSNAVLILSVGRLTQVKGMDVLVKAFAKAAASENNLRLVIAGEGEDRPTLEQLCNDSGIDDMVIFTGLLDDVTPALSAANIFVLASRNEGMGRALIEAMAASLPPVGTQVGGIPTIIEHGKTGMLVPSENPDELARKILELASDPELRERMGREARQAVYPRYDETTMISQLAELYRRVAVESSARLARGPGAPNSDQPSRQYAKQETHDSGEVT